MKKINFNINKNGSVLIFSLFVMMISLVIGISLMSNSVVGRKSSLSSNKSVNSFQVADSGLEYAFMEIRKYKYNNGVLDATDRLSNVFGGDCQIEDSKAVVTGSANDGEYKIYFFRTVSGVSTAILNCTSLNSRVDQITKIKVVGTYQNIVRSVESDIDLRSL